MFKKTTLAAALVLGLVSFNAAATNLDTGANTLAKETAGAGPTVALGAAGAGWDIVAKTGYAFSSNEQRNIRIDCSNVTFDATKLGTPTFAYTGGAGTGGAVNVTSGPNGANSAVVFSISAGPAGSGATSDLVTLPITTAGGITLGSLANANCTFSLYQLPADAFAGGTAGRIYTTGEKPYLKYDTGMNFTTGTGTLITAYAGAPAFSQFLNPGGAIAPANNAGTATPATLGHTGAATFGLVAGTFKPDGTAAVQADIYGTATKVVLTGDVGSPAGVMPAGFNVWLDSNNTCDRAGTFVNMTYATKTFTFGVTPLATPYYICYAVPGNVAIPDASWSLVATALAGSTSPSRAGGVIKKEGIELQATIANFHPNYVNRVVVSNDTSTALPYSIRILQEAGNGVTTNAGMLTGTLAAKGDTHINLNQLFTGATNAPRATLILSVNTNAGAGNQVKAMYQITQIATGAVSNAQMVRMDAGNTTF